MQDMFVRPILFPLPVEVRQGTRGAVRVWLKEFVGTWKDRLQAFWISDVFDFQKHHGFSSSIYEISPVEHKAIVKTNI